MWTRVEDRASRICRDVGRDRSTNIGRRRSALAAEHDEIGPHQTCVLDNFRCGISMGQCCADASTFRQCARQREKRCNETFRISTFLIAAALASTHVKQPQLRTVHRRQD